MADYKHTENGVIRLSDGAAIPNDPGNRDWVAYQEYVDAGGDTDPEQTPDEIATLQQSINDSAELQIALDMIVEEKLASVKWSASKQYHVDDIVIHNGKKWKATSNNSANEPDNVPGDWEVVS